MEGSRAPRPSSFMPEILLQGEEDVNDSCIVIFILHPRSLHQSHGGLTESSNLAVLVEIEITSNLEHLAKWELEPPFVLSPRGHVPPARPWAHRPVT